jgi:hypothetical protein
VPSGSTCVGYFSGFDDRGYLDPTESQTIANKMAKEQHNPQSFSSVGRELMQEDLVVVHQFEREGKTVIGSSGPKRIHGSLKRYYWVDPKHVFGAAD